MDNDEMDQAREYAQRSKDAYLWREGEGSLGEKGPTGDVGMEEVADPEFVERELNADRAEAASRNPSDLNDPGDPEAQDVGIPGGIGSGGEASEGGSGGLE